MEHGLRVVDWAGIGRVMVFVARNGLENLTQPPGKDVGVDRDKALAVPYVLEDRYGENNPFVSMLDAFERDQQKRQQSDPARHKKKWSIPPARQTLKAVGGVTRYEAGTGHATPLNKKLVDVMRERGYRIIPVGGEQGTLPTEHYLLERVLFELNFMASNVLALRPGVVAAYGENPYSGGSEKRRRQSLNVSR